MAQLPVPYDPKASLVGTLFGSGARPTIMLGIEWSSLSVIEDSPLWLRVATVILSIAALAVYDSKYQFLLKGTRTLWDLSLVCIVALWLGLTAWAVINYDGRDKADRLTAQIVAAIQQKALPSPADVALPPSTASTPAMETSPLTFISGQELSVPESITANKYVISYRGITSASSKRLRFYVESQYVGKRIKLFEAIDITKGEEIKFDVLLAYQEQGQFVWRWATQDGPYFGPPGWVKGKIIIVEDSGQEQYFNFIVLTNSKDLRNSEIPVVLDQSAIDAISQFARETK
jgi:hypothetical protein